MKRDKEFRHALQLLEKNFYKVIEVNLDDGTYFEVKVDDNEPMVYKNVNYWAEEFAKEGVFERDRQRFLDFFNPFKLKERVETSWQRVYYRRRINGNWRWVCMEVIPGENFSKDDPIVLIVVRDIEDYMGEFEKQIVDDLYEKIWKNKEEAESMIDDGR